jgi:hypothetical protein
MQTHQVRADRPPLLRRLALIVALAAVFVASSLALGGPAQASDRDCTTGSSSGNVYTCVEVIGSRLYVDDAYASALVRDSGRYLKVCLRGPNGTIGCTPTVYVPPTYTLRYIWNPNRNVTAGDYCANTWRLNIDDSYTRIGHVCVRVYDF